MSRWLQDAIDDLLVRPNPNQGVSERNDNIHAGKPETAGKPTPPALQLLGSLHALLILAPIDRHEWISQDVSDQLSDRDS